MIDLKTTTLDIVNIRLVHNPDRYFRFKVITRDKGLQFALKNNIEDAFMPVEAFGALIWYGQKADLIF